MEDALPENSFNYYGYDKETYLECSELITMTNRKHIFIMISWFLFVNVLYLIFSTLNLFGLSQMRIPFYVSYVAIAFLLDMLLFLFPQFANRNSTAFVYLTIIILLSYGIIASVLQPYMPATMYLVLLILSALSFIDMMYRIVVTFLLFFATFLASSFIYKTFSIAYHDMYNGLIVLTLALGLHYMYQRTRVQQFVLYQRDLHIQRELEIKSSFDALTSLFNRGKFFALAEEIIRQSKEDYLAVCLLDLDGFKQVNDTYGHQMGDKVIQIAGRTLLESIGIANCDIWALSEKVLKEKLSFAGRLGGDEFIVFIQGASGRAEVRTALAAMLASLNEAEITGLNGIQASFGATEIIPSDTDFDGAYRRADEALYRSKRAGKNRIFFSDETEESQGGA